MAAREVHLIDYIFEARKANEWLYWRPNAQVLQVNKVMSPWQPISLASAYVTRKMNAASNTLDLVPSIVLLSQLWGRL